MRLLFLFLVAPPACNFDIEREGVTPEECADGIDNDGNRSTDCEDPGCSVICAGGDADVDVDTDGDADSDTDSDTDADSDTDSGSDTATDTGASCADLETSRPCEAGSDCRGGGRPRCYPAEDCEACCGRPCL